MAHLGMEHGAVTLAIPYIIIQDLGHEAWSICQRKGLLVRDTVIAQAERVSRVSAKWGRDTGRGAGHSPRHNVVWWKANIMEYVSETPYRKNSRFESQAPWCKPPAVKRATLSDVCLSRGLKSLTNIKCDVILTTILEQRLFSLVYCTTNPNSGLQHE